MFIGSIILLMYVELKFLYKLSTLFSQLKVYAEPVYYGLDILVNTYNNKY